MGAISKYVVPIWAGFVRSANLIVPNKISILRISNKIGVVLHILPFLREELGLWRPHCKANFPESDPGCYGN